MNKLINSLLILLFLLTISLCIIFKNIPIYAYAFFSFICALLVLKNKGSHFQKLSSIISLVWFLICDLLAIGLNLFANVDVTGPSSISYAISFMYFGLIVITSVFAFFYAKYKNGQVTQNEKI